MSGVSGGGCHVSGVRCWVSGVRCQVSGVRCQVSGVSLSACQRSQITIHHSQFSKRQSLLIFILLLFLLTACYSTPPVVKVGLVAPFEGEHRAVGYDVIYSARLAVRELNEQGGIGGYRVALVSLDDRGEVELARATAVSLINDPDVVAVVGHWQVETTAAAAELYEQAGVPFIALTEADVQSPDSLDEAFRQGYESVTPFDEQAGDYAGGAYRAFQEIWSWLETAVGQDADLTRQSVHTVCLPIC